MTVVGRLVDRFFGLPEAPVPGTGAGRATGMARDLRVPMPDGARLVADLYRPRGAGPLPVVLMRTPYGKHKPEIRLFARVLVRRGLQVVVQNMRGVFGSDGEFRAFHDEKDDGLATLAWLRAQPWCDGRVAIAGASYLGFAGWAMAPYADPPLEAMGLGITASEFVSSFYPGGALALHNTLVWSAVLGTLDGSRLGGLLPTPLHDRRVRRAMRHLPVGEADTAAIGRPEPFLREVTAHAGPGDGFWTATDHSAAAAKTTAPASMVAGWWDLFLRGQLRDFAALHAAGRQVRITIGPWGHDAKALRAILADQVTWLDAHLNGTTDRLREAPVRLYLQKADRWLDFGQWPPPGTRPAPLYLSHGLTWDEPSAIEPAAFTYDPLDPTPSVGGPLLSPGKGGQRDNGPIERRADVAVLTGAPLDRDLDLIGPVSATLHVRTSTGHGDLFVRLCDVDERGTSRNVTDGVLRISSPGTVRAEIEMNPTAYRFARGHRLRVMLAGGAFPRLARNHGTGEPAGRAVASRRVRFEVLRGAAHPSALHLPVWDG
ncbi:CocE/NonD family hydrolase [Actinomadura rubrisoli]|uniref:CocE/NonD family hydrolase n=1 Tax=Actinomadura rubrisoli TaxID=2530368 RepID=A0A4R5BPM4_9ACTN|nr:CocE/NonD family hydrolase [Actinomadura rubrisoli]TDD88861.1 CocE/NonD family hydrolase [Actinomadura rubrisoli]